MSALPDPSLAWPIVRPGVALICDFEKCRLRSFKPLPTDPWTVGWGATGPEIGSNTAWTQQFADHDLCNRLTTIVGQVRDACTVEPNENELAAMVSLTYNIGIGWDASKPKPRGAKDGFRQSTVLKRHNSGDRDGAARAFDLWNMSAGKVVAGLTNRRKAEAALYLTPPAGADAHLMPQTVDAESSLAKSPIAQSGGAITVTGVVAAASEFKDALGPLGDMLQAAKHVMAEVIGVPPTWVMPMLLVGVGLVVINARLKQRREGWA